MKIILTQDVPKLGAAGTVQDVAPGFARNYLIPKGFATVATRGSIKQVEERQASEARKVARLEEQLKGTADRIQGMRVQIEARVGEQGRLYGSVTNADVAAVLSKQLGEDIDRRTIDLPDPIRTIGEHQVTVRLVGRLTPSITVVVWDPENPHASTAGEEAEAASGADGETDDDGESIEA